MTAEEEVQEIQVDFTDDVVENDADRAASRRDAGGTDTSTTASERGAPTTRDAFEGFRPVVVPVPDELWEPLCRSLGVDETATETAVGARLGRKLDALVKLLG